MQGNAGQGLTQCLCESCARLAGVAPGKTSTQQYRVDCEVRTVLSWRIDERRAYLAEVEKRRGVMARSFLEDALRKEFDRRRDG